MGRRERLVDVAPIHVGFGGLVAHDELVFGRTPGELTGADYERAAAGEVAFPALDGVLQQLGGTQVPVRHVEIPEALLFETVTARPDPRVGNLLVFGQHRNIFPKPGSRPYRRIVS